MSANTAAAVPQGRNRPAPMVLAVRVLVVLIAVAALLSPLYAALRGLNYLNQAPPPSWGTNVGTTSTSSNSTGAGTSGSAKSSGFGGC